MSGQENRGHVSSEKMLMDNHGADRRCSIQRWATLQHQASISNVDGFDDFEEFVLDFDDYDLLESIHSQLGSPLEPIRKLGSYVLVPIL